MMGWITANIGALWAVLLTLVAVFWTHEEGYKAQLQPKYEPRPQLIAACRGYAGADVNVLLNCEEFLERELK